MSTYGGAMTKRRRISERAGAHSADARRWRSVRRQVDALDISVFDAVAHTQSPLLDATMPPLTRAADRSMLWIGVAGLLALTGRPRARRGAVRGLASIAVTSLIANQVSKRLHRRPRPSITQVPQQRLAHRIPTSTSFPSGHSASAMAFAAGVSAEWPILSVPLRTLAGLVGFSRVATGAHYPSDVVAGFALGEAIAWLTTRVVPAERVDPAFDDLTVRAGTPRPDGAGMTLVINPTSGSGRAGKILPTVRRALPRMRIVELGEGTDYGRTIDEAASSCEVLYW
ncbi:phosphatase PAP2 family protein [Microbacterium flavum]|uniref:phosphatase PAP2 family protein n=1 Tax=Microbacterium flavum TaxID=415216 RepID=UPI0024AE0DAC|nr:phosphatase PAP2 family protein [Microbacterium flavum]